MREIAEGFNKSAHTVLGMIGAVDKKKYRAAVEKALREKGTNEMEGN